MGAARAATSSVTLSHVAGIPDRNRLNFSWLLKLRWSQIVGQIFTILGVFWLLGLDVPFAPLFAIVGVELVTNVMLATWLARTRAVSEWQLAAVMALDVALLTGLLYFTGGPFNPFSFLYLVNISLAAVALRARWTWMLVGLALICFGGVLLNHRPLPIQHLDPEAYLNLHQRGMWVAFGVAAAFIVHFLLRVTGALSERERELSEARSLADRQERTASLVTMAAGAAHELSTPLGTIALVAKELERSLSREGAEPATIDDMRLIRQQVGRCRMILDQMSGQAGRSAGEAIDVISVHALVREATAEVRDAPPLEIDVDAETAAMPLRIPPNAVAQALRNVVTNAQDASAADEPVRIEIRAVAGCLRVCVRDRGRGMTPEVKERAGEPFFTTKPPGLGMGLGLFLTREVVEKLGGELSIASWPGRGTEVTIAIPAEERGP
jgi:two-component system, sensor histidine kinase RegB